MAVRVRLGGAWVNIVAIQVFASGAWRSLVDVEIRSGSQWHVVTFGPPGSDLALSISPSPFDFTHNTGTVTGSVTATPTNGVAPYTYAWSILSSANCDLGITPPGTSATAALTARHVPSVTPGTATLRCVVTDSLGNTATHDVSGTFTNTA